MLYAVTCSNKSSCIGFICCRNEGNVSKIGVASTFASSFGSSLWSPPPYTRPSSINELGLKPLRIYHTCRNKDLCRAISCANPGLGYNSK